ncbi:MAG: hypothetical protein PHX60_06960 [Giesbergeria sp.]|uniref:hypothetical protein n=1 Tax=Giesbergeria sp. TaxID=2818473 RepID=UPI00260873BE|nr:hypothetical protein [Giesbergeria sp.]MDD2609425.1 hypothetical protein [Giesbergeria sp.]
MNQESLNHTPQVQPEALRLADALKHKRVLNVGKGDPLDQAADELLRLHTEYQALATSYGVAQLEIENLQARLIHVNKQHRLWFARAQELEQTALEPLTADRAMTIAMEIESNQNFLRGTTNWVVAVTRAIEAAHGIVTTESLEQPTPASDERASTLMPLDEVQKNLHQPQLPAPQLNHQSLYQLISELATQLEKIVTASDGVTAEGVDLYDACQALHKSKQLRKLTPST